MAKQEDVISHLQIISTWASFAKEHNLNLFTEKHLEKIVAWVSEAISLLKEQDYLEDRFNSLSIAYDDMRKEQENIVRCKECKHWSAERINDFNKCRRWINIGVKNFATMGDWFCADGVAKDSTVLNK